MRRLIRTSVYRRRDRGAVATLVAVVMASGVILGMAALSVDVGNIMFERRQLQNGSDAAAMALAQVCAIDATAPECTSGAAASTALGSLASANSQDNAQAVPALDPDGTPLICGHGAGTLPECTQVGDASQLAHCLPIPAGAVGYPYVEVRAKTKTASGGTLLPAFFSQALTGNSNGPGVTACSRAAWGPGQPSNITVLALTMSECDWATQVGYPGATHYPPGPAPIPGYPYGYGYATNPWPTVADPSVEMRVWSKGNPVPGCDTSSPGGTAPGGFGWISGVSGSCTTVVYDGSWLPSDTGADGCDPIYLNPYVGTVVYVPVFDCRAGGPRTGPVPTTTPPFDCASGTGANVVYHISGFAAFYLTGYKLNGTDVRASIATGRTTCGGSGGEGGQQCLFGWFLQDLIPAGEFFPSTPTDPNYGLTIVKPAG